MNYKIDFSKPDDLEVFHKYLNNFFSLKIKGISLRPDGITLDKTKEYFPNGPTDKNKLCLLAKLGINVVGNLILRRHQKLEYRHSGEFGMTVLPDHQNNGLGTAMIKEMEKWSQDNSFSRLELNVWSNNVNAIRLYNRHGYLIEGIRKDAIISDSNIYDLILMAKKIG